MGSASSSVPGPSSCSSLVSSGCSSSGSPGPAPGHASVPPGVRLDDAEVEGVLFVEKAILACPLPAKAWIELGRWNPVSLLLLAPAWSYHVSGPADHWWFVTRSANHMYYYIAQFCCDGGRNHVSGCAFLGMWAAITSGLQYPDARWWYAREWTNCALPRSKTELDNLVVNNPVVAAPYSWIDNNCQHFAVELYEGDEKLAA
mmetsp:Transcript_109348/g.217195  ORF Transcript_109348/g.217195 Transcript_109348/m.217195 type:complete len:202 (-) Transcript_109348:51-656(-)